MIHTAYADPVLDRLRRAVVDMYGNRLDRIILFGSRARGDNRPDSDYDVAVLLKDLPDRWRELDRLAALSVQVQDEVGALVDVKPYLVSAYNDDSPLMWEIRRDGLDL